MSLKKKEKTKIGFSSILRLIIFLFLVFALISFLAGKTINSKPADNPSAVLGESFGGDILGELYSQLPESSRSQIENINQTPIGKFFADTIKNIQSQLDGFPQKQIKDIKKNLIKNISDDMIRSLDEN
jgi:hypothetical protein